MPDRPGTDVEALREAREVIEWLLPFAAYPECICQKVETCECNVEEAQRQYQPTLDRAQAWLSRVPADGEEGRLDDEMDRAWGDDDALCECGKPHDLRGHADECPVGAAEAIDEALRVDGERPAEEWKPPSAERVPINIHPEARDALRNRLLFDPALRGVGYSEFIMLALFASSGSSGGGQLTAEDRASLMVAAYVLDWAAQVAEPSIVDPETIKNHAAVLRRLAGGEKDG